MVFNENQIKAINTVNGNTSVIACAGSGKTSVIIERIKTLIQDNDINPSNILAITFSRKAKENIENRLEKLDGNYKINVHTFHSFALGLIKTFVKPVPTLWTQDYVKEQQIYYICKNNSIESNKDNIDFYDIFSWIAMQKHNMCDKNNLIYTDDMPYDKKSMKKIFVEYERYKAEHNLVEFDDLLNIACDLFTSNPLILAHCSNMYQYIMVDEFQDVSKNQAIFLQLLTKENNNLFVVGDGLQAIYAFRGGKSEYLLEFDKYFNDTKTINLNMNYRSTQSIINTANALADNLKESKNKYYVKSETINKCGCRPVFKSCEDSIQEAEYISNEIQGLIKKGYSYKDITVLARTNAQLQTFESEFAFRNIPAYNLDGHCFLDKFEIKLVISYIRLSEDANDDEAFEFVYNKPNRWLDKKFFEKITDYAMKHQTSYYESMQIVKDEWKYKKGIKEIEDIIYQISSREFNNVGDQIKFIYYNLNLNDYLKKSGDDGQINEKIESIMNFIEIAKKFKTIKEFKKYLEIIRDKSNENHDNSVALLTIHKSKGLEFPVVFVAGCTEGILPHARCSDINEELHLAYVAITRAIELLYMTSVESVNNQKRNVSCFIPMIEQTINYA